jgi:hypothetical protein
MWENNFLLMPFRGMARTDVNFNTVPVHPKLFHLSVDFPFY